MNTTSKDDIEKIRNRLRIEQRYSEDQILKTSMAQVENSAWGARQFQVSIPVLPKDFINTVLIVQLGQVAQISAWLAFVLIGNGIEFLGKCIDSDAVDWDKDGSSSKNFNDAIRSLSGLKKYEFLIERPDGFKLYKEFRCGLTHGLGPKARISLSSKDEAKNLTEFCDTLNFHIDELYLDFKKACEEVIARDFPKEDKMNRPRIFINAVVPLKETE
jgi:hypothetical protein